MSVTEVCQLCDLAKNHGLSADDKETVQVVWRWCRYQWHH